ncbi:MAG TPA: ABC-2 family transporter protein [Gemmatales bacterium]|nr:ABC-2 family transporter protein [Gemmatales bacterium]
MSSLFAEIFLKEHPVTGDGMTRYLRLYGALAQYSFTRELSFRSNFLAKMAVEIIWLALMLVFYQTIYRQSNTVAGWTQAEFLFYLGCYVSLEGFIETLFLENCLGLAELVRTGELDFYLLKPMDEQFLLTTKSLDLSTMPNILLGMALMGFALREMHWQFDLVRLTIFVINFLAGLALAYSCLLMLASTSFWLTRNSSMMEMWWLFTSLMRYPRDIFREPWAYPIGFVFSFLLPVMLVIHVPASVMVKTLDPVMSLYLVVASGCMLWLSRWFLHQSMARYRSASS